MKDKIKIENVEEATEKQKALLGRIKVGAFAFLCGVGATQVINDFSRNNTYYVLEEQYLVGDEYETTEFIVTNEANLNKFVSGYDKKYNIIKKVNSKDVSILQVEEYNFETEEYDLPTAGIYEIIDSTETPMSDTKDYRLVCVSGNNHHYFKDEKIEDYVVVKNESDVIEIKNKILNAIKNNDKIIEMYKDVSKKNMKSASEKTKEYLGK